MAPVNTALPLWNNGVAVFGTFIRYIIPEKLRKALNPLENSEPEEEPEKTLLIGPTSQAIVAGKLLFARNSR